MGFFNKIKAEWKAKTTAEKVNFVLDLVCKLGAATMAGAAAKKSSEGHNVLSRVCVAVTCTGLGMVAGDIASEKMQEAYGKPIAELIDTVKEKKGAKANG